jgi:hypothetical protein
MGDWLDVVRNTCLAQTEINSLRGCVSNYTTSSYCSVYTPPPDCPPPLPSDTVYFPPDTIQLPADTLVLVDTLNTCNIESFYEDFNRTISDPALYAFMVSVFAGLLAIKAVIKTIKAAVR